MLGAGTVINPIIKIVTTVAILAAIGFFIVKPVLDTTEKAIEQGANFANQTRNSVNESISEAQFNSMRTQVAARIQGLSASWPEAGRDLRQCARKAGQDALALERCLDFATKVGGMVSDRNFSTSYATSLRAQGEAGAADRIEKCVKGAGYKPAAMGRCRDLADRLLFG